VGGEHKGFAILGGVVGFAFLLSQVIFWSGTSTGIVREHCLDVDASERTQSVQVDSHWTLILFPPMLFSAADPAGRCVRNTPLREGLAALSIWSLDAASEQVRVHAVEQYQEGSAGNGLPVSGVADDTAETTDTSSAKTRFLRYYARSLEQTGIAPEIARCYTRKLEALPESFFEKVNRDPHSAAVQRLSERFNQECVESGTTIYDSNISAAELERSRQVIKAGVTKAMHQQGASSSQVACMQATIDGLTESELRFLSTPSSEGRSFFQQMARECGAA
jgi:hypothetical protein